MSGTWKSLANQPSFNMGTMILLTDGRIMVNESASKHWHALTPDNNGSYINGTWSDLADMANRRLYYASGILKDGRLIICGGEYSDASGTYIQDWTNKCEIYDPLADSWSSIPTPLNWTEVGDSTCCVLPDGRFMLGNLNDTTCAIYDPSMNSWSPAASKAVKSDEETWILLNDNTILTIQCWSPYSTEKYNILTDTWQNEGNLPVTIVDTVMQEIGPAMLMYNGKAIFFGAANSSGNGKTVIYTLPSSSSGVGTWTAGKDIPKVNGQTIVCNDCPASLLPNGNVLFTAANFLNNNWGQPVLFFEYDPVANSITQVASPSNNGAQVYLSRLMLLPTGEVLFSPGTNNVQCYVPSGNPADVWRPTVTSLVAHTSLPWLIDYFILGGTQLNGLSQANIYGDDCYCATNYPIVRLQNISTNEIYYARTFNFSTMGVATGNAIQSLYFSIGNIPDGTYDLFVVANGISSFAYNFHLKRPAKPRILDNMKLEFEYFGKLVAEGDPWKWREWVVDPEIREMKAELRRLEQTVRKLSSIIQSRELPEVGKEIAGEASATK
jgi:hypothetical protein